MNVNKLLAKINIKYFRWLEKIISPGVVIVLSILWGGYVLGQVPLNIRNIRWLWGDLSQVHVAWIQFLSDPNSVWLMSDRLSFPLPMNFSLFDPMPILLLLSKPFSGIVPEGTQCFGIYFILCLVLQGGLGYLVVREILRINMLQEDIYGKIIKVVGGAFFILAPYTYYRFQGHTALSSQWILVLSIWVVLRTRNSSNQVWIALNCITIFLATGINPYLAFMVGVSTSIFTLLYSHKQNIRNLILRVTFLSLSAFVGLYVFGFLGAAGAPTGGYGFYSMNILGPIDSNGMANILSLDVNDATGGQSFEGYNYLGIGLILLFSFGVGCIFQRQRNATPFPFKTAMTIVFVSYGLAISTNISLSSITIEIPFPDIVKEILSKLRASGRLFWIGGFWIIVISIAALLARFPTRRVALFVVAFLIVQIADVSGIALKIRNSIANFQRLEYSDDDLNMHSVAVDGIIVYPPWQCDHQKTPGGIRNYEIFGYYSARRNIPTNNFYAARTLQEQFNYHCNYNDIPNRISDNFIYVLSAEFYEKYGNHFNPKFDCNSAEGIDDSFVCVPIGLSLK